MTIVANNKCDPRSVFVYCKLDMSVVIHVALGGSIICLFKLLLCELTFMLFGKKLEIIVSQKIIVIVYTTQYFCMYSEYYIELLTFVCVSIGCL